MIFCSKCGTQCEDNIAFCPNCGAPMQAPMNVSADPSDHTAEFDPKDISDNKVIAMLVYLAGFIGIIIALLAANSSPYVAFHVRQGLKLTVVSTLLAIAAAVLFWTFIVPIAAGICSIIILVIQIICFFQVCAGKAKEPAIISGLGFLK